MQDYNIGRQKDVNMARRGGKREAEYLDTEMTLAAVERA
jgi:hypothetical protein